MSALMRRLLPLSLSALLLTACGAAHSAAGTSTVRPAADPASQAAASRPSSPAGNWPEFGDNPQRTDAAASSHIDAPNAGHLQMRTVMLDGIADSSAIALNDVRCAGTGRTWSSSRRATATRSP